VIKATVGTSDGAVELRLGSHRIPVDDRIVQRFPSIHGLMGRDVGVGVRPDAIRHDPESRVRLSVMSTERDDQHTLVHLAIDAPQLVHTDHGVAVDDRPGSTIVMSIKPTTAISLWEPFHVSFDTTRIHLFDLSTGQRIEGP
jgi:ABC-type sugar transport system ATPase subunit